MKEQREAVVCEQSDLTTYTVNGGSSTYMHGIFYMNLYFANLSLQLRAFCSWHLSGMLMQSFHISSCMHDGTYRSSF